MCGEKVSFPPIFYLTLGSPPRVRGKVTQATRPRVRGKAGAPRRVLWLFGITPACAGKRSVALKFVKILKDHPRVCGEKVLLLPPLPQPLWITPACAGKSSGIRLDCKLDEDHPRVCGEKHTLVKVLLHLVGSPPRVRGKDTNSEAGFGR